MMSLDKRHVYFVLAIIALVVATLACGSPSTPAPQEVEEPAGEVEVTEEAAPAEPTAEPTDEPTPVPPTATPPPVGMSRNNPFLRSEVVSAPNWDVQVLEVVRGEEAWTAIQAANMFNEPPPEGMEYLLVRLHVKCTYDDSEEHSISGGDFQVTGDRLIAYFGGGVVEPEPQLDAQLYAGGETEGWAAYLIGQGEGSLILIVDEILNWDEDRLRYIALDEGASISVAPELADIAPTGVGLERTSAAPLGETVITEDWEVTILEVVRGEDAWTMAYETNEFNEPPAEGMEYIAIRVHVRYIGTADEATMVDGSSFQTTGDANVLYDLPAVVDPSPALDARLFPGGEYEGWVVLQVAQGETGIIAVFEPLFDLLGTNKRFLSLEQ